MDALSKLQDWEGTDNDQTMKSIHFILLAHLITVSSYAQEKTVPGDHYLFPEFTQGVVLLKTGKNDPKLLNYHALAEQLVFDSYGKILAVPKEQLERIDTVYIMDRKFVIINNKFVELLHHSSWDLYVEHKCALKEQGKAAGYGGTSQTSAISTPSSVALGGNVYDLQLPAGFKVERYSAYWLNRNGELKQFVSIKQLKRLYKEKGDLFNEYLKEHEVEYEDQQSILQLVHHLESN